MDAPRPGGLRITPSMLANARNGLGNCNHCRSIIEDAKLIGIPVAAIEAQLADWQPKFEGLLAYHSAAQGTHNGT